MRVEDSGPRVCTGAGRAAPCKSRAVSRALCAGRAGEYTGLAGDCPDLVGVCTGLVGVCTGLAGVCTGLVGVCVGRGGVAMVLGCTNPGVPDCTNPGGVCSGVGRDFPDLVGVCPDLVGVCTGLDLGSGICTGRSSALGAAPRLRYVARFAPALPLGSIRELSSRSACA